MAGLGDLKLRPSDRIRFGSLEFLVGAHPEARGGVLHLSLVSNDDDISNEPAEPRLLDMGGATAGIAPDGLAVMSPPNTDKLLHEAECERITRCLDGLLGPRPFLREGQEPRFSLADVLIQLSGEELLTPKTQGSDREPPFVLGLSNAVQTYARALRRQMDSLFLRQGDVPQKVAWLRGHRPRRGDDIDFDPELTPRLTRTH